MRRILQTVMLSIVVAISGPGLANAASLTFSTNPLIGLPGDTIFTTVLYEPAGASLSTIHFELVYDFSSLAQTDVQEGSSVPAGTGFSTFISPGSTVFDITGSSIIGPGPLADLTFEVLAGALQTPHPLDIVGAFGFAPGSTEPVNITFIRPTTPSVPEPTAVSLLGLGLGALGVWRRVKAHEG